MADALTPEKDRCWPLGAELSVSVGPCRVLGEAVGTLLGRPLPGPGLSSDAQLRLELPPVEPAGWMLLVNGVPSLRICSSSELTPTLEGLLVGWAVRTRDRCLALHGAAAEIAGRTALLLGTSGSGKSSLCLSLALRGARYLSDEVTFVRAESLVVEPFPKAITLKRGSFQLIPERETHADPARGPIRYFAPDHAARMADTRPAPALIVFPRFDPGCRQLRETRLGPEETAFRLVGQCFGGLGRLPDSLATLARLSARGSYAMEFSDGSAACQRIEQLVGST